MKYLMILAVIIPLSGCETLIANAVQDYNDTRIIIRTYVHENTMTRRDIRKECFDLLRRQTAKLEAEGQFAAALSLWANAYPAPVTVDLIKSGGAALEDAPGCG